MIANLIELLIERSNCADPFANMQNNRPSAGTLASKMRYILQVSTESNPAAMTIALSRSHHSPDVDVVRRELGVNNTVCSGSIGLKVGLICEGRAHLYVHTSNHTSQWDACAPDVIIREAGGRTTDLLSGPLRYNGADVRNLHGVIASSGTIHDRIAKPLQSGRRAS